MTKTVLTRRAFLQQSGTWMVATTIAPTIIIAHPGVVKKRGAGDVVLARDPAATDGLEKVNAAVVQSLVDKAICAFTGLDDVGAAWKSIFPKITKATVIGLKPNCVAGTRPRQLCTQVATCDAIVNGLSRMTVDGASFPVENIIIWERWSDELTGAGYKINETGTGARVIGISSSMDQKETNYGYDGNASWHSLEDTAYFTTILSKMCDYQINVPVLKSIGRGVTFSLKNMYGTFSSAYPYWAEIGTVFHKEFDQRMVDLNSAPLIREKFVLQVGDCLLGLKARGPAGAADFSYGGILMTRDPVAADAIGVKIIRDQDVEMEYRPFMEMAEKAGLGTADLTKIKLEQV